MADALKFDWEGAFQRAEVVNLTAERLEATNVVGDIHVTSRSWVRDALEARPGPLFTTTFITAFAAALGVGAAGIALAIVWGLARHG